MAVSISAQRRSDEDEEFLQCPICLEPYDNNQHQAKCLPCLHTYCIGCLTKYVAGKDPSFNCQRCRTFVTLPGGSVDGLQNNFLVENMIGYRSISNNSVTCGSCDEEDLAVSFCHDCGCFVCKVCVDQHKRMGPLRKHQLSTMAELQRQKCNPLLKLNRQCQKHSEQDLTLFCKEPNCQIPVCYTCGHVDHRGHDLADFAAAIDGIVADMQQSTVNLESKKQQIEKRHDEIKTEQSTLKSNFKQKERELLECRQKLIDLIYSRYTRAHAHLKSLYQMEMGRLSKRVESLDSLSAQMTSACEFTNQACDLSCSNPIQLLTSQNQIKDRLNDLKKKFIPDLKKTRMTFIIFDHHHRSSMKRITERVPHLFGTSYESQPHNKPQHPVSSASDTSPEDRKKKMIELQEEPELTFVGEKQKRRDRQKPRNDEESPMPRRRRRRPLIIVEDDDDDDEEDAPNPITTRDSETSSLAEQCSGLSHVPEENCLPSDTDGIDDALVHLPELEPTLAEETFLQPTNSTEILNQPDIVCSLCCCGEKSLLGQGKLLRFEPTPGFNAFNNTPGMIQPGRPPGRQHLSKAAGINATSTSYDETPTHATGTSYDETPTLYDETPTHATGTSYDETPTHATGTSYDETPTHATGTSYDETPKRPISRRQRRPPRNQRDRSNSARRNNPNEIDGEGVCIPCIDELSTVGHLEEPDVQQLFEPSGHTIAHHCCAAWSDGVCRNDDFELLNVDMTVLNGSAQLCSYCHKFGATISCLEPGCTKIYHFPCAAASGAFQGVQSLALLCPDHIYLAEDTGWFHQDIGEEDVECVFCQIPWPMENLFYCTICGEHYHGICLDPPVEDSPMVRAGWQCPSCKTCQTCRQPDNENKMMVCDSCDKGYHTFCLQPALKKIPKNAWKCKNCLAYSDRDYSTPDLDSGHSSR